MRPPKKYRRNANKWRRVLELNAGPHRFEGMIKGYARFGPAFKILHRLRGI